jgi:hypothetical protein
LDWLLEQVEHGDVHAKQTKFIDTYPEGQFEIQLEFNKLYPDEQVKQTN